MKLLKNNESKLLTIIVILLTLTVYSCNSEEEDSYVTTKLNGLYGYKYIYATDSCDGEDEEYTEDISDEKVQPYFMLEGRKTMDEGVNDLLLYYCEDRRFSTCDKEKEYLFATGTDEKWIFENQTAARYDFLRKTCIFYKNYPKKYTFLRDKLEIITEFYYYKDDSISSGDCKLKNIDYSELRCVKKKKYSMKRYLISERDQKYFKEQEEKENNQN